MSSTHKVYRLHVHVLYPQSIQITGTRFLPTEHTDYWCIFYYPQSIQITETCLLTEEYSAARLLLIEYTDYRWQMHVFYLQSLDPPCQELYTTPEYKDYRSMSSTRRVYSCARLLLIEYTDYRSQLHAFYS